MKQLNISQGSPEWLTWRKTKITSTDAGVILGLSPYCTPDLLMKRKNGEVPPEEENEFMRRGSFLEEEARHEFMSQFGIFMAPAVVESDEYSWAAASLDGLSTCNKYLLEIKCPGIKNHVEALDKKTIAPQYYAQIQHHLMVTGCDKAFYFSYNPTCERKTVTLEILPNQDFIKDMIRKEFDFYKSLCTWEVHDPEWKKLADEYRDACTIIESEQNKLEEIKKRMIDHTGGKDYKNHGFSLVKVKRSGSIDYKNIPELKVIDLEQYRGSEVEYWKLINY